MLFLVIIFVGLIIFLAFYLDAALDRREEKKLGRGAGKKRGSRDGEV